MSKLLATYGSLRKGDYNFERFRDGLQYLDTVSIKGFKLYCAAHAMYPFAVRTNNSNDILTIDLLKIENDTILTSIKKMEVGAGYHSETIQHNNKDYIIYLFNKPQPNSHHIKSGDWLKFKDSNGNSKKEVW